jgi:hypothetical protein
VKIERKKKEEKRREYKRQMQGKKGMKNMVRNLVNYILIAIVLCGCSEYSNPLTPENTDSFLNVYMNSTEDNNGYYHLEYDDLNYNSVLYQTEPEQRVFWGSPNDFDVEWMGEIFTTPIINYSTYADYDGNGQQMFYVDQSMVGDTLQICGMLNSLVWDNVFIILEDNE